ncbi:MAG: GAF domain-containing sensor histidine kinase [Nitrospinae bacterium]|nr:GAF domain-containing sensor histidine kinase [Nitrospinota bacterium]
MRIGAQMMRFISSQMSVIEKRFELLAWIDKAMADINRGDEKSGNLPDARGFVPFLDQLSLKLEGIAPGNRVRLYTVFSEEAFAITDDTSGSGESLSSSAKQFIANVCASPADKTVIADDAAEEVARAGVHIQVAGAPPLALVLEETLHTDVPSSFTYNDIPEFLQSVSRQCALFLEAHLRNSYNVQFQRMAAAFFGHDIDSEGCWSDIVSVVGALLPNWGPFRLAPLPLVQVLTLRPSDQTFLFLRASRLTSGAPDFEGRMLLRNKTICGLFLDNRQAAPDLPYGQYNPSQGDNQTRYAAYNMNAIPQSELVVPIIDDAGAMIGLINLEHDRPDAFSPYHIEIVRMAAVKIAPYIKALLVKEDEHILHAHAMRYGLRRVQQRVGGLFRHKMSQPLKAVSDWLHILDREQASDPAIVEEAVQVLSRELAHIKNLSDTFMNDMGDAINYERLELIPQIEGAIAMFDLARDRIEGEIDIALTRATEPMYIFGSPLMKEHLYNIVNNSIYAIRKRIQEGGVSSGRISITCQRQESVDKRAERGRSINSIHVRIADNGGGMEESAIKRAGNERYSTKPPGEGTGFGMLAAREYMKIIGGDLTCENNRDGGLTVCMKFPEWLEEIHLAMKERLNVEKPKTMELSNVQ